MAPKATDAPSFVTVACKLPHGLQLQVGDKKLIARGANAPDAIAGFGLTAMPEDFWNAWEAEHKTFEPFVKGLIFAQPKNGDARAEAKEKEDLKTGLEPLDPNAIVSSVKPTPEMKGTPAESDTPEVE